jgi:hypothetical protein
MEEELIKAKKRNIKIKRIIKNRERAPYSSH